MNRRWDRGKSIVNGQHMRTMKYQMDTEYQAYLRHQEQEREQAEHIREKQAVSRHSSQHATSIYSARSYNKPWQTGMTPKGQIPGRLEDENGHMEHQYISTVSKLPSIKKGKEPIRMKAVLHSSKVNKIQKSNTAFQPRITVEKKRVHARQPSSKSSVTHFKDATERRELKWQEKPKVPRKPEIQNHRFKEQEKTSGTENKSPCLEQNMGSHNNQHDQVLTTISTPLLEQSGDLQTISEPMSFRLSPINTNDDRFNSILEINTESNLGNEESSINDQRNENMSLTDSVSTVALPLGPQSDGTPLTEHGIGRYRFLEVDEESSDDSETEEFPVIQRLNNDFNTETPRNRLDITTNSVRNSNNLPPLTSPRSLGLRSTLPLVADNAQNNAHVSFLNLSDMIELRRIGVAIAPPTQENDRRSHVAEIALPQLHDININPRSVQSHGHHLPLQTTFRTEENRNRTTPGGEAISSSQVANLGHRLSSTSPTISILNENLDLIAQTISMQRQSERIINITPDKETVKPKPDPEKLKKIQASLLEEDSEDEGDQCRICLTGGETSENQLLAPCRCTGSLKHVHKECMKKWLISKIKSGAELSVVKTCEMCKQNVECNFEDFDVEEHYRKHQDTQASLNPSLYLVLLLHLYQQRYEELLRLSNTRDRVTEISRRFSNLSLGRHDDPREDNQDE
ncbi:putative E3 ubiquitin-protein ligase MARCHF10 [Mantella aurantiaca]